MTREAHGIEGRPSQKFVQETVSSWSNLYVQASQQTFNSESRKHEQRTTSHQHGTVGGRLRELRVAPIANARNLLRRKARPAPPRRKRFSERFRGKGTV